MDRVATDQSVVVEQSRMALEKHAGEIEKASFDRGFYSEDNERELQELIDHVCLPHRHRNAYAEQMETASVEFHRSRQQHSGIESAIAALQSGNGLARCRGQNGNGF